jgi:hypothetical protein
MSTLQAQPSSTAIQPPRKPPPAPLLPTVMQSSGWFARSSPSRPRTYSRTFGGRGVRGRAAQV